MGEREKEDFERPALEPKGKSYRLVSDWHTDCKGLLAEKMTVPAGFVTDGASIPRFLWPICGSPMDAPRIYAALVHDWIYSGGEPSWGRKSADKLYRNYNVKLGMAHWKAEVEYKAIRLFGGSHWEGK